jgi:3,4-dihydroxy 2-butanone 4-phosphate synthase/GTP cyclohydrolase II
MMQRLASLETRAFEHFEATGRPLVTLTYAQSVDGSIAARPGAPLVISGSETKEFTHQLRSVHDAILVGIGTVLADNPNLTARRVQGKNPQPVILDTRASFPLTAQLLEHPTHRPWIVCGPQADAERVAALIAAGAKVVEMPIGTDQRIDLPALLRWLGHAGFYRLMVEGGAEVITSFLRAQLVNEYVLTIAPMLVGGVRGVHDLGGVPRLINCLMEQMGTDWVLWAEVA